MVWRSGKAAPAKALLRLTLGMKSLEDQTSAHGQPMNCCHLICPKRYPQSPRVPCQRSRPVLPVPVLRLMLSSPLSSCLLSESDSFGSPLPSPSHGSLSRLLSHVSVIVSSVSLCPGVVVYRPVMRHRSTLSRRQRCGR